MNGMNMLNHKLWFLSKFGHTLLFIILYYNLCTGIPVCQQHLIYKEMELEDEFCLEEYK